MLVLREGMRTTKFPRSTFNESFPWCSIDFHRKTTDGPGENCLGESDLPSIRRPQDFPKFDGPHHSPRLDSAGTAGFTQPATCRSCSLRNHRLNGWTYINADLIYWSVISVSVPVHGQSSHLHGFPSVVSGSHRKRWTGPRWLWQLALSPKCHPCAGTNLCLNFRVSIQFKSKTFRTFSGNLSEGG